MLRAEANVQRHTAVAKEAHPLRHCRAPCKDLDKVTVPLGWLRQAGRGRPKKLSKETSGSSAILAGRGQHAVDSAGRGQQTLGLRFAAGRGQLRAGWGGAAGRGQQTPRFAAGRGQLLEPRAWRGRAAGRGQQE